MRKIKVLHCLETIYSGGVEQRRLLLSDLLDDAIFEQKIVCTQSMGTLPDDMEKAGMEVLEVGQLNNIYNPRPYQKVNEIIDSYQPDIIHGAVFEGNIMATICGTLKKVPLLVTEETSNPINRSWRGNLLIKWMYKLSDKTIGVSSNVCEYLTEKLKLEEDKVALIKNGVQEQLGWSEKKVKDLKSRYGIANDDFVVGTVGRLVDDHKKVSVLIRVVNKMQNQYANIRLLVVGDGLDKEMLQDLALKLSIEDRITLAGYQSDPTPFYQMMDVFALASQREAFGLVNVEAMFRNLPVVATNVGGIPTIVQDGETGLLVPPNDVSAFSRAIEQLYKDKNLRQEMGKKGYKRAKEHFSAESYAQNVSNLYQSLLKEKGLL